ncbi:hypothetical protein [Euzebya sp.]|uniref:hypothetical protein n=1 Tax=Euzebya sp. TaxID=1971409 RepID=UPI00351915E7
MRGLTFRLGGIPVRVDATFWIIMGLFGVQRATVRGSLDVVVVVEWIALVFVGILAHELGHAIAFRGFGRQPSITLHGMGGLTSASGRLTPGRRLVSTLAGPGVGFALGGIVLLAQRTGLWSLPRLDDVGVAELMRLALSAPFIADIQISELIFLDLLFINVGWGLLNLVPLHPLDGGQSLEALLDVLKVKAAKTVTSAVGVVVAAGIGVWALQRQQIFLLLIMVFLGLANVRRLSAINRPAPAATQGPAEGGEDLGPHLQHAMRLADQALQQGREDEAVELLAQEHRYRPTPASARMYLAVLARTRRYGDLEQALGEAGGRLDAGTLANAGAALVAGGRYESALRAAEAAWNADGDTDWRPAVTAAAARAGLRDVDGAVRWLYTAADRGWADRRRLETDPIFAEVRADPRLPQVLDRMGA